MRLGTLKNIDFNRVIKEGKCLKTRFCIICYLEGEQRKFGFTVKKKIKCKPLRNRIKRRIREIIRLNTESTPSGWWVFIGLEEAKDMDFREMQEVMMDSLKKLAKS